MKHERRRTHPKAPLSAPQSETTARGFRSFFEVDVARPFWKWSGGEAHSMGGSPAAAISLHASVVNVCFGNEALNTLLKLGQLRSIMRRRSSGLSPSAGGDDVLRDCSGSLHRYRRVSPIKASRRHIGESESKLISRTLRTADEDTL
jgi:hypothetical protein